MNTFRPCHNPVVLVLVAGLCGITLSACEPNSTPPTQQAETAPAASTAVDAPQAPALRPLDATARKVALVQARLCNIESIDGSKPAAQASPLKDPAAVGFSGWVGDEKTGTRPADARLRFESLNRQQAWEWGVGEPVVRKDVAKDRNVPTLENGGFRTKVDLSSLPQGEYRVYLVYGSGSEAFLCDNGRRILR